MNKDEFEFELRALINRYSIENGSNTPDYVLAGYLVYCLNAFEFACASRETWYGRYMRPGMDESREGSARD